MEDFLTVVLSLIVIAAGLFLLYVGAIALYIVLMITLALGWIPLLVAGGRASFSGSFMEVWAAIAWLEYGTIFGVWFVFFMFAKGGAEIPNWLKAVSFLFPHPASDAVAQGTQKKLDRTLPTTTLEMALSDKPATRVGQRMRVHQGERLKKDMEAEKAWLDDQEELARKAVEIEIQRARVDELEKIAKEARKRK